MIKCPRCRTESSDIKKEWKYATFKVKKYYCKKCEKSFNAYFHGEELSFRLPK